jgi:hypothetical protein
VGILRRDIAEDDREYVPVNYDRLRDRDEASTG